MGTKLMGQNSHELMVKINPLINKSKLILEKESTDFKTITNLKFYLTSFSLSKNGETVWSEKDSYHLIDASNPSSLKIKLNPDNLDFDEIHFLLGTDSLTNVAGVMGGDLDPTKGMYWAWNSGYINFKLEGKSNGTPFKFHLGGYAPPYQSVQTITLKVVQSNVFIINFNVANFINQLDLTQQNKLMSPGKDAQRLSKLAASLFYINE